MSVTPGFVGHLAIKIAHADCCATTSAGGLKPGEATNTQAGPNSIDPAKWTLLPAQ
jgi:hypothetical protein